MQESFAEMAVALFVSRAKLESDLIKLRRLCASCQISDMGTAIALEGFERDVQLVECAAAVLKELSRYEPAVRKLMAAEARRGILPRFMSWAQQQAAIL